MPAQEGANCRFNCVSSTETVAEVRALVVHRLYRFAARHITVGATRHMVDISIHVINPNT